MSSVKARLRSRGTGTGYRSAYSLVEIMVALFIFGVMMAAAAVLFSSAFSDSESKDCRANMQTIANAEDQYRLKSSSHSYTTTLSNLSSGYTKIPKCPSGGAYTITISNGTQKAQNGQTVPSGDLIISCSDASHGKFAPGIDSN
ncbi:MAG TPA: type II secretion system protein [Chthonomonadales bacterium]|nr:type II secretion system protein [Chthonomonadales bacterium]